MKSGHAYISHTSKDRGVFDLVHLLESATVPVWIAPRDVPPGADWPQVNREAIEKCRWFIVVIGPASIRSLYVCGETELAVNLHKPIFPVWVEEMELSPRLSLILEPYARTDGFGPARDENLARLLADMTEKAGDWS